MEKLYLSKILLKMTGGGNAFLTYTPDPPLMFGSSGSEGPRAFCVAIKFFGVII